MLNRTIVQLLQIISMVIGILLKLNVIHRYARYDKDQQLDPEEFEHHRRR